MNGRVGWLLLIAGVAAWDIFFDDTLSEAFGRAVRSRRCAPSVVAAWLILTAHLFDIIPQRYDPFAIFLQGGKRISVHAQLNIRVRRQLI